MFLEMRKTVEYIEIKLTLLLKWADFIFSSPMKVEIINFDLICIKELLHLYNDNVRIHMNL